MSFGRIQKSCNVFALIIFLTAGVGRSFSFAQTINIIAGNGAPGYLGDGGAATSARVSDPLGVFIDTLSDDIYSADRGNSVVRKISYSSGIITTVAGSGSPGFSGDGGLATTAQLNGPQDISLDALGNLYIIDLYNNRIRKVDVSTGIISTIAGTGVLGFSGDGGLATAAELAHPSGIAFDFIGNLYFCDANNQRVRKIDMSTGIINTIAGTGTLGYSGDGGPALNAKFNFPVEVFVQSNGNIYIGDANNYRIRKIDAATGIITTIAGTGLGSYSGDGGLAISAEIKEVYGIFVDRNGNLYFSDANNYKIRRIDYLTGIVTRIAGTSNPGLSSPNACPLSSDLDPPTGIYLNSKNHIYFSSGNTIRKIVEASAGSDTTVCYGDSYIMNGEGGQITSGYYWLPSSYLSSDTAANPIITPLSTTTYTLTVSNGPLCVSYPEVTVTVDICAGIYEYKDVSYSIQPNPSSGPVTINFKEDQKNLRIKLIDLTGRVINDFSFTGKEIKINRFEITNGIYLLQMIREDNQIFNEKIIFE